MNPNRWSFALESGALAMPPGRALLMGASRLADYRDLGEVVAVTGHYPDHAGLQRAGLDVATKAEGKFAAALVEIVKSKPQSLAMVAEALEHLEPGGLLMVDGMKAEGIESLLKFIRAHLPVEDVLSKAHGKLFWLTRPETLPEAVTNWHSQMQEIEGGYLTAPGMFSADKPDDGSELLVALLPPLSGHVADFGAGWGYLAAEVLAEQADIARLTLVEADHAALEAAKLNVRDGRAAFLWDDVTSHQPEAAYDVVISNPPFHTGRAADPGLGQAFIAAAARCLKPSGRFFMVANRHLPYEAALKAAFGTGRMLAEMQGYKLYEASKPKRQGK